MPALWQQVHALLASRRPSDYDQVVSLPHDPRDLAGRGDQTTTFTAELNQVRAEHARKTSIMQRLDRAMPTGA